MIHPVVVAFQVIKMNTDGIAQRNSNKIQMAICTV